MLRFARDDGPYNGTFRYPGCSGSLLPIEVALDPPPGFVGNLAVAQRTWMNFRSATINSRVSSVPAAEIVSVRISKSGSWLVRTSSGHQQLDQFIG